MRHLCGVEKATIRTYLDNASDHAIAGETVHHHQLLGGILAIFRPNFRVDLTDGIHFGKNRR
jgi:hypothetical protein